MTGREMLIGFVAAPLAVGRLLIFASLNIEYSFFNKSPSDLKAEAKQTVEKLEGHKVESAPQPSIEPNVGDLQTLLELADKLRGTASRNAEFQKIATLAIKEEKLGFALLVANKIFGTTARNEQFVAILDKCIELKHFDLALKAADSLFGTDARNEEFKKIIDAGIKLQGKKEL